MFLQVIEELVLLFRKHSINLHEAFRGFDRDGDGVISPAEFRRGLQSLSLDLTSQQITDLVGHMDRDGDGCINILEFKRQFGITATTPAAAASARRRNSAAPRGGGSQHRSWRSS